MTPDITGPAADAFELDLAQPWARSRPDWTATLRMYFIRHPTAHLHWSWWTMIVIHLRDIPNTRPPIRRTPASTHELLICALDPELFPASKLEPPTQEQIEANGRLGLLHPIDVVEQIENFTDEQARQLLLLSARSVCNGFISPDQDYRTAWKETIAATAEHLRAGLHMPD